MYNQYHNNGYNGYNGNNYNNNYNNNHNNNKPNGGGSGTWILIAIGIIVGYVIFSDLDWNNTNMIKWVIGIIAVIILIILLRDSNPGGRNNGTKY